MMYQLTLHDYYGREIFRQVFGSYPALMAELPHVLAARSHCSYHFSKIA